MAWADFMRAIRQNDDEEVRRQREGGVGNRIFGFLDDAFDTAGNVGKKVAGGAAGLAREAIIKPIATAGQTLQDASESNATDAVTTSVDQLRQLTYDKRKEALNNNEGLKLVLEKRGVTDPTDENLDKAVQNRQAEEAGSTAPITPDSRAEKLVLGNEPIQSYQQRYEGLAKDKEKGGAGWGVVPALIGTAANVALDSPISLGLDDAIKSIGKGGIKKLADAGTTEAVQAVLNGKVKQEIIDRVAPLIAQTSDPKQIKKLLRTEIPRTVKAGLPDPKGLVRSAGDALDTVKTKVDDFVRSAEPKLNNTIDRPDATAQKAMEDLLNKNDIPGAQKIVDTITDLDVKRGMQSTLDALTESPNMKAVYDPVTKKITRQPAEQLVDAVTPGGTPPIKPPTTGPQKYGDDADEILGLFKSSSEIDAKAPKVGWKQKANQQFFDKLAPLQSLVGDIEKRTGRKLATEENPYELARLYAGMPAAVKQRVGQVTDALEQSGDIDAVRVLGTARRILGRAEDYKGAINPEKASRAVEQLRSKLGEEGFRKANATVDSLVQYNETLLKELGDSGVISKEGVEEIIKRNPDYFARFQAVEKILEKQGRDIFTSGQSLNLSRQNVVKALDGMAEGTELLDPIESIVKSTDLAMRSIARNNIWKSMDSLADEAPELVQRVRDPENVTKRIALSLDNKELRPIRDKAERMMKTRGKWVSRLESQINQLEKRGKDVALKNGGVEPISDFSVKGLGGKGPTSKLADQMGTQDTGRFIRNLIEGPNKEIVRLKKMVGTRDANITKILDDIQLMKGEYDDIASTIKTNAEDIQGLADLKTPAGYDVIGGFKDGVGGRLAIPKEVADVYKGMTPSQMNYLTKVVGGVNRVMKEAVTSLSLPFAFIRNPIRDFKTMAANSQNIPAGIHSLTKAWTKGFASALKKDEVYQRWIDAGGGGAGIYANVDSAEKLAQKVSRKVNGVEIKNTGDFVKEMAKWVVKPVKAASDVVQKSAATLEAAPRLAEFQAAVAKGKSDEAAAFASRNVTVDFNQSGTVGQVMNQWIPFLNARMQGNKKLFEAAKKNPARFAGVYTTLTAAPIIATAALNQSHKDVLEQIDQNTKDNNFLIVLGNKQDEDGNFTEVVKIPKGDMDKIFGNPLENFVNYMAKNDSKGFGQVVTEFLGSSSPVDFVKDGEVNVSRLVGGLLPVALKAPVESATNRNLYYDSQIVPDSLAKLPDNEQVKTNDKGEVTTSKIDQFLGAVTGTSPLKTQNTRQAVTGQMFSKDPGSQLQDSVSGASDNATTSEFYKVKKKVDKNKASASKHINESIAAGDYAEAQRTADNYNKYLRETYTPFSERYGKYMNDDLIEQYEGLKITLSSRSVKQRRKAQLEKASKQALQ